MSNEKINALKNELAQSLTALTGYRAAAKAELQRVNEIRASIRFEREVNSTMREELRAARNLQRFEKMEARLQALKNKINTPKARKRAARKASEVVQYTAEQIAEYNNRV